MQDFPDPRPVAVITGASSGIGAALARSYARRGYRLGLLARREGRLADVARECLAQNATRTTEDTLTLVADVTDRSNLEQALNRIRSAFGRIDLVIANAGFGVRGRVDELEIDDFRRQFDTNVFGVLHTVLGTLPDIKSQKGRVGIVGSVNSFVANEGAAAYAMSKHAVRALAEALHIELADHGASCTLIAPGFVESEIQNVDNHGVLMPHRHAPPPSWMVMKSDRAAEIMVHALERRAREVVVTGHGKLFVFLARHLSGLFGWLQILIKPLVRKIVPTKPQSRPSHGSPREPSDRS